MPKQFKRTQIGKLQVIPKLKKQNADCEIIDDQQKTTILYMIIECLQSLFSDKIELFHVYKLENYGFKELNKTDFGSNLYILVVGNRTADVHRIKIVLCYSDVFHRKFLFTLDFLRSTSLQGFYNR